MFITKFLWIVTGLVFLGFLTLTNMQLPDPIKLDFENADLQGLSIRKAYYFYTGLGIFLLISWLIVLWGKLLGLVPASRLLVPNRTFWNSEPDLLKICRKRQLDWTKGVGVGINIFLIFNLLSIYTYNDPHFYIPTVWLYVALGLAFIGWIVGYFFAFNPSYSQD